MIILIPNPALSHVFIDIKLLAVASINLLVNGEFSSLYFFAVKSRTHLESNVSDATTQHTTTRLDCVLL